MTFKTLASIPAKFQGDEPVDQLGKFRRIYINPRAGWDISPGAYRFLIRLVCMMDSKNRVRIIQPWTGQSTYYLHLKDLITHKYISRTRPGHYQISEDFAIPSRTAL